jgi:hypothetical protein
MNFLLRRLSLLAVSLLMISADPEGCEVKISKKSPAGLATLKAAMAKENWDDSSSDDKKVTIWINKNNSQESTIKSTIGLCKNKTLKEVIINWKHKHGGRSAANEGLQVEHIIYWLTSAQVTTVAQNQIHKASDVEEEDNKEEEDKTNDQHEYPPGLNIILTADFISVERSVILTESPTKNEVLIAKLIYSIKEKKARFKYEYFCDKSKSTRTFTN